MASDMSAASRRRLQARLERLSYQQLVALALDQADVTDEGERLAEQHLFSAGAAAASTSNALANSCFRHLADIGELCFVLRFAEARSPGTKKPWLRRDDGLLGDDDAFCVALVCHSFYAAVSAVHPPIDGQSHRGHTAAYHNKRFLTTRRGACMSVALLRWATEQCHLPLTPRICRAAAAENQLEALKWARAAGCEWNETTCEAASEGGHFELLHWAYTHNAPTSTRCATLALWEAGEHGSFDEKGHYKKNGLNGPSDHHRVFKWLTGDTTDVLAAGVSVMTGVVRKVPWVGHYSLRASLGNEGEESQLDFGGIPYWGQMGHLMHACADQWDVSPRELVFWLRHPGCGEGDEVRVDILDTAVTLRIDTESDPEDVPMLVAYFVDESDTIDESDESEGSEEGEESIGNLNALYSA